MTSRIAFRDLAIEPRRVDVLVCTTEAEHHLWFEFTEDLSVSTTTVAIALSTLCGHKFDIVEYNFPVDPEVLPAIREMTSAHVRIAKDAMQVPNSRSGNLLSFSGGFDSLTCLALMPDSTKLVSMDFGGRFARERKFFEAFDTTVISTNLLTTQLQRNSWSFMGIGAILSGAYYNAQFHTFGGVLQAGPDNLRHSPAAARGVTFPAFRAAGYTDAPYVLGLTEIGALRVLLQSSPELISDSLVSLASPGEEKLYRKATLVRLVSEAMGVSLDIPEIAAPKRPHFAFGQSFSLDMLALYSINRVGHESGLVRDVPARAYKCAQSLSLRFFDRANSTLFENFPAQLAPDFHQKLAKYGIKWYAEKDWAEYQEVRDFMSAYYTVVKT